MPKVSLRDAPKGRVGTLRTAFFTAHAAVIDQEGVGIGTKQHATFRMTKAVVDQELQAFGSAMR